MSAEALLGRLNGVRAVENGRWMSRCPAHEDKTPSLAVRETVDGTILLKCFAGCSVQDICDAVGLSAAALFPPRLINHRPPERRPFDPMQVLLGIAHEALVVGLVAEQMVSDGMVNDVYHQRLGLACARIQRALQAVGELPEAPELKRLRRGEYSPSVQT